MPELPEVETVRRGLAPIFEGSSIFEVELRRADLRFPFPPNFRARLKGRRVATLRRRAKYLVAELDNGEVLIMHLGMSGSFRIDAAPLPGDFHFSRSKHPAHDHVVFNFESGARVTYNDPRRFGFMLLLKAKEIDAHPLFAKLGLEPLDPAMNAGALAKDTARPRDAAQVRAARSKKHRRARQYLCLRSASPRENSRRCGSPEVSPPPESL